MAKAKYIEKDFPLMAQDYARQGLNDKQIAAKLGISISTYYQYQVDHSDFSDAIKKGKSPVDVMVENAFLKRALGFEYEEIHTEYRLKDKKKAAKKKGEKEKEEEPKAVPTIIKKIKKFIPPDVAAGFIWMKNRRSHLWKDKHEIDIPGVMKIQIISKIPRSKDKKNNNANRKNA